MSTVGIPFLLEGDISSSEVSVWHPLIRYKHLTKQSAKAHRQTKPRSSTSGMKAQVSFASFASTLLRCRYTKVSPSPPMLPGTAPAVAVRVTFLRRGLMLILADERSRGIGGVQLRPSPPVLRAGGLNQRSRKCVQTKWKSRASTRCGGPSSGVQHPSLCHRILFPFNPTAR